MKIRILADSIRLRLTKSDVQNLKENGKVVEETMIAPHRVFRYTLVKKEEINNIAAQFENDEIAIMLSDEFANIITDSDQIGVEGLQDNGNDGGLFLLVEKDLKCLEHAREDQSDMYENPNETC